MNTIAFFKKEASRHAFFTGSISTLLMIVSVLSLALLQLHGDDGFLVTPAGRLVFSGVFVAVIALLVANSLNTYVLTRISWQKTAILQALVQARNEEDLFSGLLFAEKEGWSVYDVLNGLVSGDLYEYQKYLMRLVQREKALGHRASNNLLRDIYATRTWRSIGHVSRMRYTASVGNDG